MTPITEPRQCIISGRYLYKVAWDLILNSLLPPDLLFVTWQINIINNKIYLIKFQMSICSKWLSHQTTTAYVNLLFSWETDLFQPEQFGMFTKSSETYCLIYFCLRKKLRVHCFLITKSKSDFLIEL